MGGLDLWQTRIAVFQAFSVTVKQRETLWLSIVALELGGRPDA